MFIPVPPELAQSIGRRSSQLAREWSAARGWKATRGILPYWDSEGNAGIRATRKHLIYQSMGTKPFLMHAINGKRFKIGRRWVTVTGVGESGFINLPTIGTNTQGESIEGSRKVWRDQKWRHPGLKPQNFLQDSIMQSVKEHEHQIRAFGQQAVMRMIEQREIPGGQV